MQSFAASLSPFSASATPHQNASSPSTLCLNMTQPDFGPDHRNVPPSNRVTCKRDPQRLTCPRRRSPPPSPPPPPLPRPAKFRASHATAATAGTWSWQSKKGLCWRRIAIHSHLPACFQTCSKRQQSPPTRPLLTASCALRLRHLEIHHILRVEVIDSHSFVCRRPQTRRHAVCNTQTTPRAIFGVGLPSHPCSALEATKSTPCCRQQPTALHIDGFPSFASFPSKSPRPPHSHPAERPPTTDRSLAHRHRAIARIL